MVYVKKSVALIVHVDQIIFVWEDFVLQGVDQTLHVHLNKHVLTASVVTLVRVELLVEPVLNVK